MGSLSRIALAYALYSILARAAGDARAADAAQKTASVALDTLPFAARVEVGITLAALCLQFSSVLRIHGLPGAKRAPERPYFYTSDGLLSGPAEELLWAYACSNGPTHAVIAEVDARLSYRTPDEARRAVVAAEAAIARYRCGL